MEPGELNALLTIEQPATVQDALGQPIGTWATVARVWASVRHTSGLEAVKSGAVSSGVQSSIRLRFRGDITPAMRLVHGGTVYAIRAVLPDRRRQYVDLVCEVWT